LPGRSIASQKAEFGVDIHLGFGAGDVVVADTVDISIDIEFIGGDRRRECGLGGRQTQALHRHLRRLLLVGSLVFWASKLGQRRALGKSMG
jgi:hypothetical protein